MKTVRMHLMVQLPLVVLLAACNAGKPVAHEAGSVPVVLDQRLATLAVGQQGYVCQGSDTYTACACIKGDVDKWTCSGMTKMCKTAGAGTPTCTLGVCSCERHM